MGYFSALQLELDLGYEDYSYPSPERQLLWRLEDLADRLQDLEIKGAACRNGAVSSDDNIRYTLPENLSCIYDAQKAIELAKQDLFNKYGLSIPEYEEPLFAEQDDDFADSSQITMMDFIVCQFKKPLNKAA